MTYMKRPACLILPLILICGPIHANELSSEDINSVTPSVSPNNEEDNNNNNTVSVSFGFDNTSGTYGTQKESTSTSFPATLSYDTDNYLASLTVSYLEQTGPAGSIAGTRRRPIAFGSNKIVSERGWGDVTGSIRGYLYDDEDTGISLDVKAAIKFATADASKGLGTGKNDYSLEADLTKDFDKSSLLMTVGYTVLGSPGNVVVNGTQENITLQNIFYASVGSIYQFSKATSAGLTLSAEQSSESGAPNPEDITLDFNHKINKTNKLDVYVLLGLSSGSPDKGFGASLKSSF